MDKFLYSALLHEDGEATLLEMFIPGSLILRTLFIIWLLIWVDGCIIFTRPWLTWFVSFLLIISVFHMASFNSFWSSNMNVENPYGWNIFVAPVEWNNKLNFFVNSKVAGFYNKLFDPLKMLMYIFKWQVIKFNVVFLQYTVVTNTAQIITAKTTFFFYGG